MCLVVEWLPWPRNAGKGSQGLLRKLAKYTKVARKNTVVQTKSECQHAARFSGRPLSRLARVQEGHATTTSCAAGIVLVPFLFLFGPSEAACIA